MFKVVYSSSLDFYRLITAMSKLVDSPVLNLTEEGVVAKHLTDDKVLMGVIDIPKDVLDDYEIEKPLSLKIPISDLKKVLAKAKSKNASIEISETDYGVKITIRDEKSGTRSTMNLKAEKGEPQVLKEPNVKLPVSMVLEGDILKTIISDASEIGEEVEFSAEGEEVSISTEESGKSYKAILKKDQPLKEINIESSSKAVYSLEVLKTVSNESSFTDTLKLSFGNNLPMKAEASTDKGAMLIFWVAPRM